MIIDLANLEWWQTLFAIVGALGLSPAPWILGLAFGRIQFAGPAKTAYDQRVADLKEQHATSTAAAAAYYADQLSVRDGRIAELKTSLDKLGEARNVERNRADNATAMLGRAVDAVEVSNHLLESLSEAAEKGKAR
jgi:hypothetical protein